MNLSEAFKRLETLNEDVFNTAGSDAFERMKDFRDESQDTEDTVDIIDLEADTDDELQDSYVGKVIIDCQVCHSKIFKDSEDIELDDEKDLVNITEECPYCHSVDGYKVLGKISDYPPAEKEEEVPEETEEVPMDNELDTELADKFEDESEEDKMFGESLNEDVEDSLDRCIDMDLGLYSESFKESLNESKKKEIFIEKATANKSVTLTIEENGKAIKKTVSKGTVANCVLLTDKNKYDRNMAGINDDDYRWYLGKGSNKNLILKNGPEDNENDWDLEDFDDDDERSTFSEKESLCEATSSNDNIDAVGQKIEQQIHAKLMELVKNETWPEGTALRLQKGSKDARAQVFQFSEEIQFPAGAFNNFKDEKSFKKALKDLEKEIGKIVSSIASSYNFSNLDEIKCTHNVQKIRFTIAPKSVEKETVVWVGENNRGQFLTLNGVKATGKGIVSSECFSSKEACAEYIKSMGDQLATYQAFTPSQLEVKADTSAQKSIVSRNASKLSNKIDDKVNNALNKGHQKIADAAAKLASKKASNNSNESLNINESIDSVNINSTDKSIDVKADDNGAVDIHIENAQALNNMLSSSNSPMGIDEPAIANEFSPAEGGEFLAPVDDEVLNDIKANNADASAMGNEMPMDNGEGQMDSEDAGMVDAGAEELPPEEPSGAEEVDVDVNEFDEGSFDDLGESYLKSVYENVNSFKTTGVQQKGNKLYVEGLINFASGKTKTTNFIFESKDITRSGKARFVGENCQICRGKRAFTVTGTLKNGMFLSESLNYNYRAKNPAGKSSRLYGTVKLSESYKNKKR